ncbi:hypothetical protein PSAB6_420023 [Paraburkholderia sabiae]|nr:hypothetical protein PSAB6_420023 [Paraburkholderia sabiae]
MSLLPFQEYSKEYSTYASIDSRAPAWFPVAVFDIARRARPVVRPGHCASRSGLISW